MLLAIILSPEFGEHVASDSNGCEVRLLAGKCFLLNTNQAT